VAALGHGVAAAQPALLFYLAAYAATRIVVAMYFRERPSALSASLW